MKHKLQTDHEVEWTMKESVTDRLFGGVYKWSLSYRQTISGVNKLSLSYCKDLRIKSVTELRNLVLSVTDR